MSSGKPAALRSSGWLLQLGGPAAPHAAACDRPDAATSFLEGRKAGAEQVELGHGGELAAHEVVEDGADGCVQVRVVHPGAQGFEVVRADPIDAPR